MIYSWGSSLRRIDKEKNPENYYASQDCSSTLLGLIPISPYREKLVNSTN